MSDLELAGRVPPSDLDAEAIVLCACLMNPDILDSVRSIIKPDDFYATANQRVFESICFLSENNKEIDVVSVAGNLRDTNKLAQIGGSVYLMQLLESTMASAHPETHAKTVAEKAAVRLLIKVCQTIAAEGHGDIGNVSEWLVGCDDKVYRATRTKEFEQNAITIGDATKAEIKNLQERSQNPETVPGITTGFKSLDKKIGGWKRGCKYTIAARPGIGKCLGKGTLVIKYDGSVVPVETIVDGDLLMGPDSKPRKVRGVTSGFGPLYKIIPTKGEPWVCNWCHVLTLRNTDTDKITDIPLNEFILKSEKFQIRNKQFSSDSIEFPKKQDKFLIPPYILGVWLGDGTKVWRCQGSFDITTIDPEISDAVLEFAKSLNMTGSVSHTEGRNCATVRISNGRNGGGKHAILKQELMRLFEYENLSIPKEYLLSSKINRLELLAGLIDTDGSYSSNNFEWCQKDNNLTRDFIFLARSLGFKVTSSKKIVNGTEYNRVFISGKTSLIPTRISRKKCYTRKQIKNALNTGIRVESIGDGEYFGFELDSDGRFLLGDFTVTHNTALMMNHALSAAMAGHGVVVVSIEMPREQLVLRCLAQLAHVNGQNLERAELTSAQWKDLANAAETLTQLPIVIVDAGSQNPATVRAAVREGQRLLRKKFGESITVDLVCIDYVQIMSGTEGGSRNRSRDTELSEISSSNRLLAKLFNCAVLELSQLNREVEKRPDKRPVLSDLRESGSLEQDSFGIIMVYRDDYYKPPEAIQDGDAELIIRKIRQGGSCGVVRVKFDGPTTNFFDSDEPYSEFDDIGTQHGF